jgi:hypothetical protein
MRKREPEGAPEERKRQFEDQRGLSDSPELPLDEDVEPEADADEKEKDKEKEDESEGGSE